MPVVVHAYLKRLPYFKIEVFTKNHYKRKNVVTRLYRSNMIFLIGIQIWARINLLTNKVDVELERRLINRN